MLALFIPADCFSVRHPAAHFPFVVRALIFRFVIP